MNWQKYGIIIAIIVVGLAGSILLYKQFFIVGESSVVKETATVTPTQTGEPTPTALVVTPTVGNVLATPTATPSVVATPTPKVVPTPTPTPAGPKSYSLAEVAKHGNASSCWSVVNGNVYDLTSWIGKHPGGDAQILSMCGKDASSAYNDQHGGQRRPESELAGFKIGILLN